MFLDYELITRIEIIDFLYSQFRPGGFSFVLAWFHSFESFDVWRISDTSNDDFPVLFHLTLNIHLHRLYRGKCLTTSRLF